jgi:hypothetical protein
MESAVWAMGNITHPIGEYFPPRIGPMFMGFWAKVTVCIQGRTYVHMWLHPWLYPRYTWKD